jgi:hypothetical protein
MRLQVKAIVACAALALGMVPALAVAAGPEYKPTKPPHEGAHETAPKGHGYGFYCKGESKKHVEGQKRTPFSECVRAAARADRHQAMSARQACKALSKKHVKGQKRTPFSECVRGVAQLRKHQHEEEQQQA